MGGGKIEGTVFINEKFAKDDGGVFYDNMIRLKTVMVRNYVFFFFFFF